MSVGTGLGLTFVSYSSKDKPWADAVCAALESKGLPCWIAPRDIAPGSEWGASIIQGIDSCRVMVLILSDDANRSPQVRREVERAMSKRLVIIPCRVEDVRPIGSLEYALSNTHWLDIFTPPVEKQLQRLTEAVRRLMKTSHASMITETRAKERAAVGKQTAARPKGKSSWTWLIAAIMVIGLALAGVFLMQQFQDMGHAQGQVTVPSLVGKDLESAQSDVGKAELTLDARETAKETDDKDLFGKTRVDRQSPVEGTRVAKGSKVEVQFTRYLPSERALKVVSPNGKLEASILKNVIVLTSNGGMKEVVRYRHGKTVKRYSQVTALEFSPNSDRLVSGAQDGSVALWDTRQGEENPIFYAPMNDRKSPVRKLTVTSDKIIVQYSDGSFATLDPVTGIVNTRSENSIKKVISSMVTTLKLTDRQRAALQTELLKAASPAAGLRGFEASLTAEQKDLFKKHLQQWTTELNTGK
jgi:hypothetical protein